MINKLPKCAKNVTNFAYAFYHQYNLLVWQRHCELEFLTTIIHQNIYRLPIECKSLISQKLSYITFLAPPAERQRSFSSADSSVVRRPSSTFQLKAWFLKNCLITFFLFWHVASLRWYQCIVKIWIWLNHPKRSFWKVRKVKFGSFFTWRQFSQKLFDNFFSMYARSFPRRVLMNCQKMDSIESL